VFTPTTATDQLLPSKESISTRPALISVESDRDESGAVIILYNSIRLNWKSKKISELLAPVGLSLVESDQIVTVITAPNSIQLASRVESDRIGLDP